MNGEQIQRLLGVYQAYNDVIIPLVFEIELEHKQFPTMILNEIRSFTAHIGRAVGSMNAQDIDNELKKAERHILRIKLDCFKVLCYGYDERFRRVFPKEHRHYDLSIVNNSSFLPEMAKRLNSAKKTDLCRKRQRSSKSG